ncbi:MAG: hypothetical protein RLZZ303_3540 [Candidatus Hydrogenedentota bacterium]|jgi:hypothetical protein
MAGLLDSISAGINSTFQAPLQFVFHPVNDALAAITEPMVWRFCAMALFVLPMLWVWFGLRKEYVNLDSPGQGLLYDLRLWTVLSMTPHVVFYLLF